MLICNSPMTDPVENNDALEKGITQPLLLKSGDKEDDEDGDLEESEEAPEESRAPVTSIRSAYKLLTPSVKVISLYYGWNL